MGRIVHYKKPRRYGSFNKNTFSPASTWRKRLLRAMGIGAVVTFGAMQFGPPLAGCKIKGNISLNNGERIYHVPGQKYYSDTQIWLAKGERWFCSEQDARAAGWRKSRM